MTRQERDYDEVLSRVLHSTTDHIEPVGDGLTKIQARLAEPWLKRQWWLLRNEFTAIGWVLAVRCQSWFNHMRSGSATGADTGVVTTGKASATLAGQGGRLRSLPVAGGIAARASAKRPRHASSPLRNSVGPAMAWLRPALAVAGAVVLVVAGVFALGGLRGSFGLSLENGSPPGSPASSNAGRGGNTNGSASQANSGSGTPSSNQPSAALTKPSSTSSAKGAVVPLLVPSSPASTPPGISPSPSPTSISPSPTATATPTATPTPTGTPTPTVSPNTSGAAPVNSDPSAG